MFRVCTHALAFTVHIQQASARDESASCVYIRHCRGRQVQTAQTKDENNRQCVWTQKKNDWISRWQDQWFHATGPFCHLRKLLKMTLHWACSVWSRWAGSVCLSLYDSLIHCLSHYFFSNQQACKGKSRVLFIGISCGLSVSLCVLLSITWSE